MAHPNDRDRNPDPPDRIVAQAILGGVDAAACAVLERGGELGYILSEGEDATARVRFRLTGDAEARERVLPLTWVLLVAAQSATIDEVSAPDLEGYTWTAAAVVVAEATLPAGLILPTPLRRRLLWRLAARDDRGMSGLLHSEDRSLSRYGPLGRVLADQVARTTIPGARGRQAQVRRRVHADDSFAAIISGAVAEYFSTPAAMTGADGGQALLAYDISSFDPIVRTWHTYASYPPEAPGSARSRRAALSDRSLRALELEVFGARHDAKKSTTQLVSLDAPADGDESGESPSMGDTLAASEAQIKTVQAWLELGELVARSDLSQGQREVVRLRAAEHTEAEIAAILGLSVSTVDTQLRRARQKLEEAAEETSEGV